MNSTYMREKGRPLDPDEFGGRQCSKFDASKDKERDFGDEVMNLDPLNNLVEGKAGRANIGINKPVINMAMADARNAAPSWLDGRGLSLTSNDASKKQSPEKGNVITSYPADTAASNFVSSTLGE